MFHYCKLNNKEFEGLGDISKDEIWKFRTIIDDMMYENQLYSNNKKLGKQALEKRRKEIKENLEQVQKNEKEELPTLCTLRSNINMEDCDESSDVEVP